jgi:hypothetical protein
MFRGLANGAWRLDQWMKVHIGRTYTIILTVGLVASVSANVRQVEAAISHAGNLAVIALTVALDLILIVNQIAQLHEYRQARRERKAERNARPSGER